MLKRSVNVHKMFFVYSWKTSDRRLALNWRRWISGRTPSHCLLKWSMR